MQTVLYWGLFAAGCWSLFMLLVGMFLSGRAGGAREHQVVALPLYLLCSILAFAAILE